MKELARNLRKNQTTAETKLWLALRKRRFGKFKFRRQHVIAPYIVDFVCLKERLILEIDGSQHLDSQEYDETRTLYLNTQGFRVLRFWNNQVLEHLNTVLEAVYYALSNPSSGATRHLLPNHLGRRGRVTEGF